jgi:C-terminal peptidase prc
MVTFATGGAEAGARADRGRSVGLDTFDYVYTRISAVHPEPEVLGAAWAQSYAELRPAAAAAKDEDELAEVILALMRGLPGAHHALIRAEGRGPSGVAPSAPSAPMSPSSPSSSPAPRSPEAPSGSAAPASPVSPSAPNTPSAPSAPSAPRAPVAATSPIAPAPPFAPGEQAMPGLLPVLFEGEVRVGWLEAGGPADRAGLRLGDAILEVDGVPCAARPADCLDPARPEGTGLQLKIAGPVGQTGPLLPSQPRTLTSPAIGATPGMRTVSVRARLPLRSGGHAELLSFSAMSMNAVQHINERLPKLAAEGARGLVLDLRGNPGGLIASAAGLAGYLVDQPTSLGRVRTRQDALELMAYPRPEAQRFRGPVAVIIDERSASTSEIIAGGLQELGLARVFGARSRGAVETSTIEPLPNGDRLQLVIATVHTPKGAALEGVGVGPDVPVPGAADRGASGQDAALDAALAWIDAAPLARPPVAPLPALDPGPPKDP